MQVNAREAIGSGLTNDAGNLWHDTTRRRGLIAARITIKFVLVLAVVYGKENECDDATDDADATEQV